MSRSRASSRLVRRSIRSSRRPTTHWSPATSGGLRGLVARERLPELERRFQTALARKDFDVNDVQAGRQYVAAYVSYVKLAEGEEHGDDHHHRHEHDHRRFE